MSWSVSPKELKTTQLYLQFYWLLTRFKFVQILTIFFPSNLKVHISRTLKLTCVQHNHRCIYSEDKYIEFYFTLDDRITWCMAKPQLFLGMGWDSPICSTITTLTPYEVLFRKLAVKPKDSFNHSESHPRRFITRFNLWVLILSEKVHCKDQLRIFSTPKVRIFI